MKKIIVFSLLAIFISVTGLSNTVEAKRFGGGTSFGKSSKNQKNFSKPAPQQGANTPNAAPQQGAASGSRAGGMMGMLGGLAMGGLLGAMFFGGGFEGINFMDILLFGGIAFAIFWFMRRAAASRRETYAPAGHPSPHNESFGHDTQEQSHTALAEGDASDTSAKPQIDEEQFLQAAKGIFVRMQADWDSKNEEDIRSFCTPSVAEHVLEQIKQLGDQETRTEIAVVYPELSGSWMESGLEMAAVHFQATLNEKTLDNGGQVIASESNHVNEVWVFQHDPNSEDPTWYLAGIQQV
ncbi:MAG: Tim44-like domain-containing protein [Ghiorsea sp.]|nr:Tim44-like domain-containing protein [Ghiorsea sp.]